MKKKKNNLKESPAVLPPDPSSPWRDIKEAAAYLHVGVMAVRRYTHQGLLACYKPGRKCLYKKNDLDQLLEKSKLDIEAVPTWAA